MPKSKRSSVASHRVPITKRSRLTVDAIFEAFADVFRQHGYEGLTTNMVAERAGVSVGAIYQYFANKEAIAVALIEERSSRVALRIRDAILGDIAESLEETVRKTLTILLECYQKDRSVLIDLPDASPRLREAVRHLSVVDLIERSSRIYLEQHADEIGKTDPALMRYVMGSIVKGCLRDYVMKRPPDLTADEFVTELSKAVVTYAKS